VHKKTPYWVNAQQGVLSRIELLITLLNLSFPVLGQELAPYHEGRLPRFHRAIPSTFLDKPLHAKNRLQI